MKQSTQYACLSLALLTSASGCISTTSIPTDKEQCMEPNSHTPQEITTASGLRYIINKQGDAEGAIAQKGNAVKVHYTGWLSTQDGQKGNQFDSSLKREPFVFKLGAGSVIRGWDEGVVGMKVGETRTLIIPGTLGYGAHGYPGVIPPNATLIFEVTLLEVK